MDALVGVLGAVVGALIVLAGQYIMRRDEESERRTALLVELSAQIIASSRDFRGRVWEERSLGTTGVVAEWDAAPMRLASARFAIMCPDPEILKAAVDLRRSGEQFGSAWRRRDVEKMDGADDVHKAALRHFEEMSRRLVGAQPLEAPAELLADPGAELK